MNEDDVQNIMRQPFTMIASDSGVRSFGSGVPHPRGYGNNARVLGRYVRELKLILASYNSIQTPFYFLLFH